MERLLHEDRAMTSSSIAPSLSCDVLVIGSGSAGLTAALAAAAAAAEVIIAEKTAVLGGTTALSGAAVWVPANHHAAAAGLADSAAEALAYIHAAAPPGWAETEAPLWRHFVEQAGPMLRFVEDHTPLRFALTPQSDPLAPLPGAKARGRMLSPGALPRRLARPFTRQLRPPLFPHLYTFQEAIAGDLAHHPLRASLRYALPLLYRLLTGRRGKGTALIVGLLRGCLDQGCRILLDAPALRLLTDAEGAVTGAVVRQGAADCAVVARRGVILASGGFEWDEARRERHFPGPLGFIASPRANSGDAHRMAEAVGAALAHMDQANIAPAIPMRYEGRPHGLGLYFHQEPGAILVDGTGRRFADELDFNLGERLDARDAEGAPLHLPAWIIADHRLLKDAAVLRAYVRAHGKDWMRRATSITDLALTIGVPAATLARTVEGWNAFCVAGADEDFGRRNAGPVGMRAIAKAPFLALPFNRSFMSTKGGPRTDADGRVLRPEGTVIPGLFCAGVAMANPIGTRAVGAGTTIGPNMVWGYICGRTAMRGVNDVTP
jgi:3-oxosteroid 1-dehydrogenase